MVHSEKKETKTRFPGFMIAIIGLLALLMMSACSMKTHTEMKADYSTDSTMAEKYIDHLNITRVEYEIVYPSEYLGKIEVGAMGPVNPRYRGAIFISDMEAKRLLEDYQWKKDTSSPPDLGQVNNSVAWGGDWYKSDAFTKDIFKAGHDEDFRFNGKDTIIFEFGTY